MVIDIRALMKRKLAKARVEDEVFQALESRVDAELLKKFNGTWCSVEVTDVSEPHLQMIMWDSREHGWYVKFWQNLETKKCYLILRDQRTLEQND